MARTWIISALAGSGCALLLHTTKADPALSLVFYTLGLAVGLFLREAA